MPKGILKTNWLSKHLTEVPAVTVQFVDLDWDSPNWPEKRLECAGKLEVLRYVRGYSGLSRDFCDPIKRYFGTSV